MYLIKTPFWLRALYPRLTWRMPGKRKVIYLSFDDGPHETATAFVLEQLRKFNAKATFFCIGKNVAANQELYQQILQEGHSVGNHTYHHVNGWKTDDKVYVDDVQQASTLINSNLFRPPYGRIRRSQLKRFRSAGLVLQTIMWDVLSADFDTNLTPDACAGYVLYHTKPGSIVLFHDSEKAWPRMQYALPKMLEHFTLMGYTFEAISFKKIE